MQKRTKDVLILIFQALKSPLMSFLEKEVIKFAISNLVKSAFMADFRIWLIKWIVELLMEEIAKPVVDLFFRKAGYLYEVADGHHTLKKIENADTVDEWRDAARRV